MKKPWFFKEPLPSANNPIFEVYMHLTVIYHIDNLLGVAGVVGKIFRDEGSPDIWNRVIIIEMLTIDKIEDVFEKIVVDLHFFWEFVIILKIWYLLGVFVCFIFENFKFFRKAAAFLK